MYSAFAAPLYPLQPQGWTMGFVRTVMLIAARGVQWREEP